MKRTEGVSAAFIKELMRRVAQAVSRGESAKVGKEAEPKDLRRKRSVSRELNRFLDCDHGGRVERREVQRQIRTKCICNFASIDNVAHSPNHANARQRWMLFCSRFPKLANNTAKAILDLRHKDV